MSLAVLYSDVDGTLVGHRGCFFRTQERSLTLAPAHALVEALEAGVALVLVSGRSRAQLAETALLLGADGFIGELGGIVGWDGGRRVHRMPAADLAPPAELVTALLDHYWGQLELHDPWHVGHEVDVLLRGQVDPEEVHGWLALAGHPTLRLRDNGVLPHRGQPVHVYHLLPDGVSKGQAVAFDLARRGVPAAQAAAVGDSLS
ncbi:MAG: HAD family hydrolase, partial [Mycobacteriales bacterium]